MSLPGQHRVKAWQAALFATLACVTLQPGNATSLAADKAALLAFKAALTGGTDRLSTWQASSDPCDGSWAGVSCACSDVFPAMSSAECAAATADPSNTRVLVLALAATANTSRLVGPLAPSFGGLAELRTLDLSYNALNGSLPSAWGGLTRLQQLLLTGNQLAGALPDWPGQLAEATDVWLDGNAFTGPLPAGWCGVASVQTRLHVEGNAGLCGPVPSCLTSRVPDTARTSLLTAANTNSLEGGQCGVLPPSCDQRSGCGVVAPQYWTALDRLNFTFTAFVTADSLLRYRYALGTGPGLADTLPFRLFTGSSTVGTVQLNGTRFDNVIVYQAGFSMSGAQGTLLNGQQYYVTVQGVNTGGLRVATNASSGPVLLNLQPPALPQSGRVYNSIGYQMVQSQTNSTALSASWDAFQDAHSNLSYYAVQIFEFAKAAGGDVGVNRNITTQHNVGLNRSATVSGLSLALGSSYFVRVYATSETGLEGSADSPPVTIASDGTSVAAPYVAIIVAASIGLSSILVAATTFFIVRTRYLRRHSARKEARGQMKVLKGLMYGLVNTTGDPARKQVDEIRNSRELAFVITDLQDSTAQAAANPSAFLQVQEIHDTAMREGISKHGGYEINTEGDSFHVAFTEVADAVLFCMETQYRLLETDWPRQVLRLPACKEVTGPEGEVVFRGPRVRMGIHYAVEGTVAHRLHLLTKHRVFSGPGFQVAQELGDSANGGQVLLSHDAWVRLRTSMPAAGFPTVEQIGLFKLDAWPAPMWVYQVTHLLGKPLMRPFPPPRRIQLVETGWGLNIVPPPQPRSGHGSRSGALSFVALRLELPQQPAGGAGANAAAALPPYRATRKLYEVVAVMGMQFSGYIFKVHEAQGRFMLAFSSTLDAVRFCHAVQTNIMHTSWPREAHDISGPTEIAPDGRLIFRGPRVATAVHESSDYQVQPLQTRITREEAVDFSGPGEQFVKHLCNAIHGGQVVLSESAWAAIQDQIPGQSQVISLGTHVLDGSFPVPTLLMEVMPVLLGRRSFPPPRTARMLEPGYRDSPDPAHNMAIVFVKVAKPTEVISAEQASTPVSEDTIIAVITAYNVAVAKVGQLVRRLLPAYAGYECKEPEPGKFTLAFRELEQAVRWCATLQQELLRVNWPPDVLMWAECQEEVEPATGQLLWRGLRVRCGMAYGKPAYRKSLNTGRADYYGNLPNLAARVSALAAPGQILVEGSAGWGPQLQWLREDSLAFLPLGDEEGARGAGASRSGVELEHLGYYLLKGLDDPKLIFQATPTALAGRKFELPSSAIRVTNVPKRLLNKAAQFNNSFNSSGSPASKRAAGLFGFALSPLVRNSSRTVTRAAGSDSAAARTRSTISVPAVPAAEYSASELQLVRPHRSTLGLALAPAHAASPLGQAGGAGTISARARGLSLPLGGLAPASRMASRGAESIDAYSIADKSSQRRRGMSLGGSLTGSIASGPSYTSMAPPPLRIGPRTSVSADEDGTPTSTSRYLANQLARTGSSPIVSDNSQPPSPLRRAGSSMAGSTPSSSPGPTPRAHRRVPSVHFGRMSATPRARLSQESYAEPLAASGTPPSIGSAFGTPHAQAGASAESAGSAAAADVTSYSAPPGRRLRVEVRSPSSKRHARQNSMELMTPGTQYAREVAQLFVAGRRRSGMSGSWHPDQSSLRPGSRDGSARPPSRHRMRRSTADEWDGRTSGSLASSRAESPRAPRRAAPTSTEVSPMTADAHDGLSHASSSGLPRMGSEVLRFAGGSPRASADGLAATLADLRQHSTASSAAAPAPAPEVAMAASSPLPALEHAISSDQTAGANLQRLALRRQTWSDIPLPRFHESSSEEVVGPAWSHSSTAHADDEGSHRGGRGLPTHQEGDEDQVVEVSDISTSVFEPG